MPGIFISYRREDTAGHAGRIFDRLRETFGRDKVFMDVAAIEPGVDFVEAIDRAVGSCDVLLVIIGKQWLSCHDAAGRNRLDDPKDFIRLETATALRRNIRVIPVLVQGASMPGEGDLPDELKKLARRQATEISDSHWDASFGQLIETLQKLLSDAAKPAQPDTEETPHAPLPSAEKRQPPAPAPLPSSPYRRTWIISAIAAMVGVLAGLLFMIGPDKVAVPDLSGLSLDEAAARLEQAKLRPGEVRHRPSERPPGSVIEQDPAPGSKLAPESAVNLVLAEMGPERETPPDLPMAEVPRLVGQPLDSALLRLERAGLKGVKAAQMQTGDTPEGIVIEQVPRVGAMLPRGETVELVIAVRPPEPELVTIPDVTGLEVKRAVTVLKSAGLIAEPRIERVETTKAEPGTVLRQRPQPGSRVRFNETVALVYAVAPPH